MKISFTDMNFREERVAEILKDCDLIFSLEGNEATFEELESLFPGKVVRLQHTCNSENLLDHLIAGNFKGVYHGRKEEYETIYASLPRGVEITGYIYTCFCGDPPSPPRIFTIPYEN